MDPTRSLKILRPMTLRINPQKLWGSISIWQHHTPLEEAADKLAKQVDNGKEDSMDGDQWMVKESKDGRGEGFNVW